jgi:hypothetical protein
VVVRSTDCYIVYMTNWLNWIHWLSMSLELGYNLMRRFNDTHSRDEFVRISDAGCYKALFPLVTYIPQKSTSGVGQISLFEIMRVFIKHRSPELKYNRDYARNVYSRIRTNLKNDYNLFATDMIDLIKNPKILNIQFNDNIYLVDTVLVKNILLAVNHDYLLLSILDNLFHNNTAKQIKHVVDDDSLNKNTAIM